MAQNSPVNPEQTNAGGSLLLNYIAGAIPVPFTGMVSNSDLFDGCVSGSVIKPGAILSSHLSSSLVSGNSIGANSIQQGHVLSGFVDLQSNQIVSGTKAFADPIKFANFNVTGGNTATVGNNCPGIVSGTPYVWFKCFSADGSIVFIPAWK